MRQRFARLLALTLTISFITGSAGIAALAEEADSISADIVVSDSNDEQAAAAQSDSREETGAEPADTQTDGSKEEEPSDPAAEGMTETEESGGDKADPGSVDEGQDAAEQEETAAEEAATGETASEETAAEETTAEETAAEETAAEETAAEETAPEEAVSEETDPKDTAGEFAAQEEAAGEEDGAEEQGDAEAVEKFLTQDVESEGISYAKDAAAEETAAQTTNTVKPEAALETELTLSASAASVYEKKTLKLTAKIQYSAASREEAEKVAEKLKWSVGNAKTASIRTSASPSVTAAKAAGSGDTPASVRGTITQSVVVTGVKEGATTVKVTDGRQTKTCKVTVKPVPAALGKSKNLRWTDTTILRWDAVKNAKSYRVTISLRSGSSSYTNTVTVNGLTHIDLEKNINGLVCANKKALTGAAYVFEASVQAISTDAAHFKDGAVVKAPSLRYLKTTYQECVKRNGWYFRDGKWYFYDAGVMQKGWLTFLGKRYYLGKDGAMLSNCWFGNRFLKANGEMARDEWVDGYKYYVNSSGVRVNGRVYNTKNWVKTKAGWRFKRKNGTYIKNTWSRIAGRTYYFDGNGYVRTGWLTLNGKSYYLNNIGDISGGYGALVTGWKTIGKYTYWFDDDGAMVKGSWVDRGQYYVNKKGHKLNWITYANLRNVNTSNRLGHYVGKKDTPPEQSIASYDLAYKNGNRIMVVDLWFTKDNVPVCLHDNVIKYARLKNGAVPASAPVVSKMTMAELNEYDYGISKGDAYKGTKLLRLEDMAKWIRQHPDTEMYIEVKTSSMSAAQIQKATALLGKYKITNRSSMIFTVTKATDTRAQRVHKAAPALRIGITASRIGNMVYSQLAAAKGTGNHVFLWCWDKTVLTAATIQKLRSKDVQYELGTLDHFDDIIGYYSKGSSYVYASGIETDGAVFKDLLSTATFHDKAVWESVGAGMKYKQIDGTYARSKWLVIGGRKYHFDQKGFRQTGWLNLGGKLYYLTGQGVMVTGTKTIAGHMYQFGENGVLIKKIK